MFILDLLSKENLKGFFKRNKKFFLISLGFFVIAFLVGVIYGYITIGSQYGVFSSLMSDVGGSNTFNTLGPNLSAVNLFVRNFSVGISTILLGLLFSIMSFAIVAFNAFIIGQMFGMDVLFATVGIAPHGIIEYSASIGFSRSINFNKNRN